MEIAKKLFEIEALTQNLCKINSKLSLLKLKVLYFISEYKSLSPSLIISKLGLKRSNLASISKTLVEEGYIESIREDKDKRRKKFSLTNKGKKEIDSLLTTISSGIREEEATGEIKNSLNNVVNFLNKKV